MTDVPPAEPTTPVGHVPDRRSVWTDDEPLKVPQWMREPVLTHELTRREKARLALEHGGGAILVIVGMVLALILVAVLAWSVTQGWHRAWGPQAAEPTEVPTSRVGDPGKWYFVGTPAQSFAEGPAAVTLPEVRAEGPFTAKQVSDGLALVRQALILARLDRATLAGDPERFLALLAEDIRADVREEIESGEALAYASRLAPYAPLSSEKPRAKGGMTYRATKDEDGVRVLEITTKFVWVYPFDVRDTTKPGAGLVVVRDEVVWQVPHPDDVPASSRGLWLSSAAGSASNAHCEALRNGVLDVYQRLLHGIPRVAAGIDDPEALFDPDASLDVPETC